MSCMIRPISTCLGAVGPKNKNVLGLMVLLFSVMTLRTTTDAFLPSTTTTQIPLFDANHHSTRKTPFIVSSPSSSTTKRRRSSQLQMAAIPSWSDIEHMLGSAYHAERPTSIDSALDPSTPIFSTEHPTLFRERHGWCPYSERVWLTLEVMGIPYDTIKIDNTGHGPRPSYYGGQTPQMKWPNGRTQGESMDLVDALLGDYDNDDTIDQTDKSQHYINQFRNVMPKARPSSRAAYLFQWNGEPLWKSTFEESLQGINDLLHETSGDGPFFCGSQLSTADIAWAPFLERYRYQLPCLHANLNPNDSTTYPYLHAWYDAMDTQIPAYACRVKGDASSWRKVLTMAGFGNSGVPPQVEGNMKDLSKLEAASAKGTINVDLWNTYASTRPHVAETPHAEAALIVTQNKQAIMKDTLKRSSTSDILGSESTLDEAMRAMAHILIHQDNDEAEDAKNVKGVGDLASFLDERMCVPRDMGAMSAASIKHLAYEINRSS